jgi:hypothetical protein
MWVKLMVAYKETIQRSADAEGKFIRQPVAMVIWSRLVEA